MSLLLTKLATGLMVFATIPLVVLLALAAEIGF